MGPEVGPCVPRVERREFPKRDRETPEPWVPDSGQCRVMTGTPFMLRRISHLAPNRSFAAHCNYSSRSYDQNALITDRPIFKSKNGVLNETNEQAAPSRSCHIKYTQTEHGQRDLGHPRMTICTQLQFLLSSQETNLIGLDSDCALRTLVNARKRGEPSSRTT